MERGSWKALGLALVLLASTFVGCMGRAGGLDQAELALAAPFAGVWEDQETGSKITIEVTDRGPVVKSVVDVDGEAFVVKAQEWTGGGLTWTYFVPSTGYTVQIAASGVEDDLMHYHWSNQEGNAGDDDFLRLD